jgi:uncharacterized membrane-anchored protein
MAFTFSWTDRNIMLLWALIITIVAVSVGWYIKRKFNIT